MPLAAFVFDAYPTAFWQRLAGTAPLPGPHRLGTEFEQGVPITALPIGEKGGVLGPLHVRGHRLHDLFKQGGLFTAALLIHQKPAGPFQNNGRPAGRVRRVNPLTDHRVNLIPFKRQLDEGMAQSVEHQRGFHPSKTALPLSDGILVGAQNPRCRSQPHAFSAQPQRRRHLAERRLDALHRGACRLREDRPTARAGVEASGPVVNRLIATVAGSVTGTTDRANQHGQRLHRFSKTHPTTRYQGKSSGSSPVPGIYLQKVWSCKFSCDEILAYINAEKF